MAIDKKLIDQLLSDYKKPEDIFGENGLLKEVTRAILERALQAEMGRSTTRRATIGATRACSAISAVAVVIRPEMSSVHFRGLAFVLFLQIYP